VGDKCNVAGNIFHKVNALTTVGSTFNYDCQFKKIGVTTALKHVLDGNTSVAARVDNLGAADILLTG